VSSSAAAKGRLSILRQVAPGAVAPRAEHPHGRGEYVARGPAAV